MDIASAQRIPIIRQMLTDGTAREIRKAAGLTLADVGSVIGVEEITVYRWETGRRTPRTEHALKLDALLQALRTTTGGPDGVAS
jgi:transcriptional regulator with XRE-family HTH domain